MLAVAVSGGMVAFMVAMFGWSLFSKIWDAYAPAGTTEMEKLKMANIAQGVEKTLLAKRSADSQMIAYLREAMPQEAKELRMKTERQFEFLRETQIRGQEFQLEAMGEARAASREELMLSRLLPGGGSRTAELMAQTGTELLQAGRGVPAMLPFDPNFPVTALPRPASRVIAGDVSFETR